MYTKKSNPLLDLDKKKINIPLQEEDGRRIKAKKAGRPPKPNMKRVVIKMDMTLHRSLTQYAQNQGVPVSSVIAISVKRLMADFDS